MDDLVSNLLQHGSWDSMESDVLQLDDEDMMINALQSNPVVVFAVTGRDYPDRLLFARESGQSGLLSEMLQRLDDELGRDIALGCAPGGLGNRGRTMLSSVGDKYGSPEKLDSMLRVQGKLDQVKGAMIDNIDGMMRMTERAEDVEEKTDELRRGAKSFQNKASDLKWAMWWRNCKLWCLIAVLVICVIMYFVVPIIRPHLDGDK